TGAHIVAGGNFNLWANADSRADATTRSITGAFAAAALANATTNLNYTVTSTVKANADVLAGNAIRVTADTRLAQNATANASGLGFGGDANAQSHTNVAFGGSPSSLVQAEVQNAAALTARTVLVAATVSEMHAKTVADGRGAGFIAIGTAAGT